MNPGLIGKYRISGLLGSPCTAQTMHSPCMGATIGAVALPTVFVQEGGYDLDVIGRNVVNVLRGFEDS